MNGKKVVLFVTGSVAAYKSIYLLRLLKKAGADVQVVMTGSAEKFISKLTFEVLSQHQVYDDDSYLQDATAVNHIELAQWADVTVVAPATANFIAEAANGLASDFAATSFLAMDCPKFVAPAMNDGMLHNAATKRNMQQLEADGTHIISPEFGELAEGYYGAGRLAEPETIFEVLNDWFEDKSQPLKGKKILITAGGTREQIDPVRFIGNNSSGKMGYALAEVAMQMGAEVTLINANSELSTPKGATILKVKSVKQLENEVLKQFPKMDVVIMAAAISDFTPQKVAKQKIKKSANNKVLNLSLVKTDDILTKLTATKRADQLIVGFAAETNDVVMNATQKLQKKGLDLIVLNDVSNPQIGFGSDDNKITIIDNNGPVKTTDIENKKRVAREILNVVKDKM